MLRWMLLLSVFFVSINGNTLSYVLEDASEETKAELVRKMFTNMDRFSLIEGLVEKQISSIVPSTKQAKPDLDYTKYFSEKEQAQIWEIIEDDVQDTLRAIIDPNLDKKAQFNLIIQIMASISPIINVSPLCFQQSVTYLRALWRVQMWAIQMLDSTGKLPDGIMSDTYDACEAIETFFGPSCEEIGLEYLEGQLSIPYGNTIATGSFDGCLSSKSDVNYNTSSNSNPFNITDFAGRYAFLQLKSPQFANLTKTIPLTNRNIHERMAIIPIILGPILNPIINMTGKLGEGLKNFYIELMEIRWGQCVPDACSDVDITNNTRVLYYDAFKIIGVVTVPSLTEENKRQEMTNVSITMIVVLSVLAAIMALATFVDVWQQVNPYPILSLSKNDKQGDSLPLRLLKCFSIDANGRKILSTYINRDIHFACLSGIRFISMAWIVLGHLYLVGFDWIIINRKFRNDFIYGHLSWSYEVLLNAFPSVDTFFFMSGSLVAYGTFIQLERKKFNLFVFLIHRYVRLTITLAFLIGFVAGIVPLLSFGPGWSKAVEESRKCEENGWINILYFNNFYKMDEQCLGQTWYLANDMQFYILSPLFIYPLWKHFKLGLAWLATAFVGLTMVMGYFVIHYDLPPSHDLPRSQGQDFHMDTEFYMRPYIRFQPYMIGILFGYFLYKTKGKDIKIPHTLNLILWTASILTGIACVFGLNKIRRETTTFSHSYTPFASLIYNCFHKTAWSLALSWSVFSCVKGYGGVIDNILSWKIFLPLSRLTYCAYLIHIHVIIILFYSMTYSIEATDFLFSQYYIGAMAFTYGASFVASLAFEAPFIGLEKIILGALMGGQPARKPTETPVSKLTIPPPPSYATVDPLRPEKESESKMDVKTEAEEEDKMEASENKEAEAVFCVDEFSKTAGLDNEAFSHEAQQEESAVAQVHVASSSDNPGEVGNN